MIFDGFFIFLVGVFLAGVDEAVDANETPILCITRAEPTISF